MLGVKVPCSECRDAGYRDAESRGAECRGVIFESKFCALPIFLTNLKSGNTLIETLSPTLIYK